MKRRPKTMIYQRKEWKIIQYPDKKNDSLFIIARKLIKDGNSVVDHAEIPENDVNLIEIYKAKTH